jgi:putative DNA primase/helicase
MYEQAPNELKQTPRWVCWRLVQKPGKTKPDKIPIDPKTGQAAKSNDTSTWGTFDQALAAKEKFDCTGIGFMLGNGVFGIDMDHCFIDGVMSDIATEVIETMNSYTELSPSGTGVHIIAFGTKPAGSCRRGGVEMYESGRFLTVTENSLGTPRRVRDCTEAAKQVHAKYIAQQPVVQGTRRPARTEQEIMDIMLRSKVGAKIRPLMDGDISAYASQSEADLALCNYSAFFSGRDAQMIDNIFRQSGLMRDKWDERRGQSTYGEITIKKAIESCLEIYNSRSDSSQKKQEAAMDFGEVEYWGDVKNAARLIRSMAGNMRFNVEYKKWMHWTGLVWAMDEGEAVLFKYAKSVIKSIANEAVAADSENTKKRLFSEARRLSDVQKQKNMIEQASKLAEVQVFFKDLDKDPFLVTCKNGTLDLRTGELRPPKRDDLITKSIETIYDLQAQCPNWLAFLDLIMGGNQGMITFLQRSVGYTLTGVTDERCIFILWGSGRNGKSTFTENIAYLMGSHAGKTRSETLLAKKWGDAIPNDVAALNGKRLVYAAETGQGRKLDEERIKELTGDKDTITARFMRGEFFDFIPEFKLWLHTNHKPDIKGTDDGIWDRIRLIPFTVRIPDDKLKPRRIVDAELKAEWPGILAWAVRGCLDWLRDGLALPDQVRTCTKVYREENDPLKDFFDDTCLIEPKASVSNAAIWQAYQAWGKANGEQFLMGRKQLSITFAELGFVQYRGHGPRRWMGISLRQQDEAESDPLG